MYFENVYFCTLENGGGTFKNGKTFIKNKGFMVAKKGFEKVFDVKDIKGLKTALNEYLRFENCFVGTWLNDGKIYLDLSMYVKTLKKAIKLGKENDQLAIYSFEENDSIYL